jgi:hypothetical protein
MNNTESSNLKKLVLAAALTLVPMQTASQDNTNKTQQNLKSQNNYFEKKVEHFSIKRTIFFDTMTLEYAVDDAVYKLKMYNEYMQHFEPKLINRKIENNKYVLEYNTQFFPQGKYYVLLEGKSDSAGVKKQCYEKKLVWKY